MAGLNTAKATVASGGKADVNAAQSKVNDLLRQGTLLSQQYDKAESDAYANSAAGLRDYLSLLANGDPFLIAAIKNDKLTQSLRDQAQAQTELVGRWDFSLTEVKTKLIEAAAGQKSLNESIADSIMQVSQNLTSAISQWDGTLKGFFTSVAGAFAQMIKDVIAQMIALLVVATAAGIVTAIGGGGFQSGFQTVLKAGGGTTGGGIVGKLFGAGKSAGAGADIGTDFDYGDIDGNAVGGYIKGPGTGTSDSILSRLSNGEYVNKASSVDYYGAGLFEAMNQKLLPKDFYKPKYFADGGFASPSFSSPMVATQNYAPASQSSNSAGNNQSTVIHINPQFATDSNGNISKASLKQGLRALGKQMESAYHK